jgi:hypothetical protein
MMFVCFLFYFVFRAAGVEVAGRSASSATFVLLDAPRGPMNDLAVID